MADISGNISAGDSVANPSMEKMSEFPASNAADVPPDRPPPTTHHLFNRQKTIHEILGGGKRKACVPVHVIFFVETTRRNICIAILAAATAAWLLFEESGYTLLSLVADVVLLLVVILFVWANAASLLRRPLPALPELELSEEMVNSTAASMRVRINYALTVAHDIALGKDIKLFFKVVICLWFLSIFGGCFNFFTLIYISLLAFLTIPALYNKYGDHIDRYSEIIQKKIKSTCKKLDANVLSKIPRGFSKGRKIE